MVKRVRLSKPVKKKKVSRRKKILSVPLNENTLESLEEWAGELNLTKTEIAREAVTVCIEE